jgi:fungal STAND N-terminal Goodbye domain
MSSTQSTSSISNFQSIIDALADYAKITGIDLSKNPFAALIEQSNSPEDVLQLLQGREKAFKEYRDSNRTLINCLSPAVKVLQAFSGILGEAVSLVSHPLHLVSAYGKHDLVRYLSHQQRHCLLGSMSSSLYVVNMFFKTIPF